ncbi:MAG: hypothetical protein EBZ67_02755 [Chitinophagia bacterium]|nr:hypothetical protein [Chitinophagia bacterium]
MIACLFGFAQVVLGPKGTRVTIDSSKWQLTGNHLFNKNPGNVGIGVPQPSAKLHTSGSVRFEALDSNTSYSRMLTTDSSGNVSTRRFSQLIASEFAALPTGILKATAGSGSLSIASAGDFPILNQNTTGNAATVTTNANLTGPVQSVGNATSIADNVVTNAMLTQVPTQTIKGRISAGNGIVENLTATQATAILNTFTSSAKGLVPASGGGTSTFLRADGVFSVPAAAGRQMVMLNADVNKANTVGNVLEDIPGLAFDVVAGVTYRFFAIIPYTSTAGNNGTRWTISTPATALLSYVSRYTQTTNTETVNYLSGPNLPASCNNNSLLTGNMATLQGVIRPTANGTVQVRFTGELGGPTITVKAGASLEWW